MKKRNCFRTDEERATHDKAVKLRKMTDKKLIAYIKNIESMKKKEIIAEFLQTVKDNNILGLRTLAKLYNFAKERECI